MSNRSNRMVVAGIRFVGVVSYDDVSDNSNNEDGGNVNDGGDDDSGHDDVVV